MCGISLWQYRLWSFKFRDTKLDRLLANDEQETFIIVEMAEHETTLNLDFQRQIFLSLTHTV